MQSELKNKNRYLLTLLCFFFFNRKSIECLIDLLMNLCTAFHMTFRTQRTIKIVILRLSRVELLFTGNLALHWHVAFGNETQEPILVWHFKMSF